MQFTL